MNQKNKVTKRNRGKDKGKKGKRNDWMTGEQRKKGEKQNGENQKR